MSILTYIIGLPLLAAIVLAFVPRNFAVVMRAVAVAATLISAAPAPWGFQQQVFPAQIVGTILLLGVILFLGWTKEKTPPVTQARPVELVAG